MKKMKKIVTIGGGNGHSSILKWLHKHFTVNNKFGDFEIASIVSMSDDGRTTGLLMRQIKKHLWVHMPPPWDLRKCSLALSSSKYREEFKELLETVMDFSGNIIDFSLKDMLEIMKVDNELIEHIKAYDSAFLNNILPLEAPIKWHKFGNVLMASLYYNFWDYNRMVSFLGGLLETKWTVLPVTIDEAIIFAETWWNELIYSQDRISNDADYWEPLLDIYLSRNCSEALMAEWVRDALIDADYIIIWPWDLYTSIDANFLIKWFSILVQDSDAKKVYIMNSNNKRGETTDFEEIDFVDFVEEKLWVKIDLLVANSKEPELSPEEKEKFKNDISVKWWRYLTVCDIKKDRIRRKYPHIEFLLWEYVDVDTLYKNNDKMIDDIVAWVEKN